MCQTYGESTFLKCVKNNLLAGTKKFQFHGVMQVLQVGGMEQVVALEKEFSNQTPLASLPTEIPKLASCELSSAILGLA